MILSVSNQAGLFLTSVATGLLIGFFYDWIRVSRIFIRRLELIAYIEDFVYWVVVSLAVFFIMLKKNDGEIRAFLIFGTLLGMLFYFYIFSALFIKVSSSIINFVKKLLLLLLDIILAPFKLLYKILSIPAKLISGVLIFLQRFFREQFTKTKKNIIYLLRMLRYTDTNSSLKNKKRNRRH